MLSRKMFCRVIAWSTHDTTFLFHHHYILNERSPLHCEIKRFVIPVLEVSKEEILGNITCGHVDMNFVQQTRWRAQITSLCNRYYRISDWTDMRAISNDFLTAVLIGCLPDDQSPTVFAIKIALWTVRVIRRSVVFGCILLLFWWE